RLRFSGPKTSIICSPMTSLKTSIKTITYLSDIGCLEIQGASLLSEMLFVRKLVVTVGHSELPPQNSVTPIKSDTPIKTDTR
ncbi:hypothetical protein PZR47_12985, partial [Escherichia coli]|uniref:hypothetical protein n=1 Tax=Escherichia coli TaxID=562 RepID=UPI002B3DA480|nr:hypothetical protein [Escherichia coli]